VLESPLDTPPVTTVSDLALAKRIWMPEGRTPVGDMKLTACFNAHPFREMDLVEKIALSQELGLHIAETYLGMKWRDRSKYQFKDFSPQELLWVKQQLGRLAGISVHGPYGVSINSYNRLYRELSIRQIKDCIQFAAFVDASLITLHLEPTWPQVRFEGQHKAVMIQTLRDLGDYAQAFDVRLAVETQYPYTADSFVQLIAQTDHTHVGATLDTGHLFNSKAPFNSYLSQEELTSPDGPQKYNALLMLIATRLGEMEKLWHIHLNERKHGILADHFALGTGFIDFPQLFAYLKTIGYQGSLVLELYFEADGSELTVSGLRNSIETARAWWDEAQGKIERQDREVCS